ncbi:MAG TPA: hypothetical protein VGO89_21835 [Streptomyces sp.]|nr:hypothetical protein [Streptomyces sp.]
MRPVRCVTAVLTLLVATGCGVRPTGVISAGDPAVARQAVPQTTIYMVRQNQLVAVRVVSVPGAPQVAVQALWDGQNQVALDQGLLNPAGLLPRAAVTFDAGVLVISYFDATPASRLTLAQLICSGAAQPGVQRVRLIRNRAQIGPPDCSSFRDLTTQ